MGLFDSIRATLSCHVCGSSTEREIQTKAGPCLMLNLEIGDTIEPFFYGDYWMEERWHCEDCQQRMLKKNSGNTLKRLLFIASTSKMREGSDFWTCFRGEAKVSHLQIRKSRGSRRRSTLRDASRNSRW
jgi:hypothetical protein